jgi:hypothetical protein
MLSGCGSFPSTGSSKAVPGAFIDRRATPLTPDASRPSPISQSAWSAVCCGWCTRCLTSDPKTSETCSLRAPDWPEYTSPDVRLVTAWVSSWPITSTETVKLLNRWPSPSPKAICPSSSLQNALS